MNGFKNSAKSLVLDPGYLSLQKLGLTKDDDDQVGDGGYASNIENQLAGEPTFFPKPVRNFTFQS